MQMSPHRIAQADNVAVPLLAAVAAAFSSAVTVVNAVLAIVLVGLVTLDVVAGTLAAYLESEPGEEWFDWDKLARGWARKFVLACLVLTCWLLDVAFAAAFSDLFDAYTPITKYGLAHAIVAQAASITKSASLIRELRPLAAFIMRRMDAARLGHEPPVRRAAYDPDAVRLERELETTDGRSFHEAAHERDQESAR